MRRVQRIDLLRGLVIAFMVLDHTRDFFHRDALLFDPTDPDKTNLVLFLTRWSAHLCAPTFVFLAGASIWLQKLRKPAPELTRFLVTRGVWLIVLELTVVAFGFNFAAPFLLLQVIWAIGVGMIGLAALTRAPARVVLLIGAVIVAGHDALSSIRPEVFGPAGPIWTVLMSLGRPPFVPGLIAYPLVPWFGVMCLGYGLGAVFTEPEARQRRRLLTISAAALGAFLVLRVANVYGDPRPWTRQADGLRTAFSFFNLSKYPPSLSYVLATLGVSLAISTGIQRWPELVRRPLLAYGRTPLFTYLLHVYLAHGLAVLVGVARGVPVMAFTNYLGDPSRLAAAHWGVGLPMVFVAWLGVLAVLYPLSSWFAELKARRRDWWLSYL